MVKRKLMSLMKAEQDKNWPKLLPVAVGLLNKRPLAKLGGIAPEEINTFRDDSIIRNAQDNSGLSKSVPDGGTWQEQNKRQEEYTSNPKNSFQVNSFVYLDIKPKTFAKSFNDQISIFFPFN